MSLIISGTTNAGVTLVAANNPVTIAATAYLNNNGAGTYALLAPAGTTWTIANAGLLAGSAFGIGLNGAGTVTNTGSIGAAGIIDTGVRLNLGGAVTNQAGGTISGGQEAISISGAPGTVSNAGAILGGIPGLLGSGEDAIWLDAGGAVSNQLAGTISGADRGVDIRSGVATVTNAGTISGYALYGVYAANGVVATVTNAGIISSGKSGEAIRLNGDDAVTNESSGTISSNYGVFAQAGMVSVTNAGVIEGLTTGITLSAGGALTNQSSGTISGENGIFAGTGGGFVSLVNAGAIMGTGTSGQVAGANLTGGASVTNLVPGTITGYDGIFSGSGSPLTAVNAGLIAGNMTAGGAGGVYLNTGGSVTNRVSGTISGYIGVHIGGGVAAVVNAGVIAGNMASTAASGVVVNSGSGDRVTNQSGGTVTGYRAVYGSTGAVTVVNAGAITGAATAAGTGVTLGAGGAVTNMAGGTISGAGGINGRSAAMSVNNAGLISGAANNGVYVGNGGVVTNQASGTITGATGVDGPDGVLTISNAGDIAGLGGNGVNLSDGGGVTNQGNGTISGANGVKIAGGAGTVANAGQITGSSTNFGYSGVFLTNGGAVGNQAGGAIGGYEGVYIEGAPGTVTNAGAILGNGNGGVWLNAGGAVTNQSFSTISGLENGIIIFGGGTVFNAGEAVASSGRTGDHGILLRGGGTVTNAAGGTAEGYYGIFSTASLNVVNSGSLIGTLTGTHAAGVYQDGAGTVTNAASGTIAGASGVYGLGGVLAVTNAGVIAGLSRNGVNLSDGGGVTNQAGGTISGAEAVYINGGLGAVTNAGTILGTGNVGVWLNSGGAVTNQSSGTIEGRQNGVNLPSGVGTVINDGVIVAPDTSPDFPGADFHGVLNRGIATVINAGGATVSAYYAIFSTGSLNVVNGGLLSGALAGTHAAGVYQQGAGNLTNAASGTITGASGVYVHGAAFSVTNAGLISGAVNDGVLLAGGSGVSNLSTGTISGAAIGISVGGTAGTVVNAGDIVGTGTYGVRFAAGGSVTNQSGGTIGGAKDGILIEGAGTVTNAGTISGATAAVALSSGFTNRVIVDPGAAFSGLVNGGNTIGATASSTLELASGATTGQLSGLGSQFIDFAQIAVDAGASWTLTGANTLIAGTTLTDSGALTLFDGSLTGAGALIDNSLIQENAATLTAASLTGTGDVLLGGDSTLTVTGSVSATETIAFAGTGLLAIAPAGFAGQIDGIGGGGQISLTGIADATSAAIVNGDTLAIQQSAGAAIDLALDPTQLYGGLTFAVATSNGNAVVTATGAPGATVISQGETQTLSSAAGTQLAANATGTGGITVTGLASELNETGSLVVGDTVLSVLAIDNGGTVLTTLGGVIANTASASGSEVNVTGASSNWQVSGLLDVGVAGSGALNISGGGAVSAASLDTGNGSAAVGDITLSGAGTKLTVSGAATVADDGTGVLSVLNGASFSAASLTIGSQGDSSGALVISGTGSTLTVSGQLNIGTALGTGDLTVGPGAVVDASVVNLQGGVVLEGGVLDPTVFIENGGSTTGGFGTVASQFILLEGTILSNGSKSGKETEVVQGTLVGGGTATINGTVSVNSPGILQMAAHDTIEVTGAVLNAPSTTFTDNLTPTGTYTVNNSVIDVVFQDGTGLLRLDDIAGFGGTIATWSAGDSFVITGGTLSNVGVSNGNTLTVADSGTGAGAGGIDTIIFASPITAGGFGIVNGNTLQAVACFAAGSRIATDAGSVAVEALRVGDHVTTADGAREPIVWIGQRTVNCRRHPDPKRVWPVRVRAGAFAENVPQRDLLLSPDHAIFVNDVLVPVKLLINGTSIAQVERDRVTYFHVELSRQAVILAEGLTVESYLETGDRMNFSDSGIIDLFPDFAATPMPDLALLWETRGAAPLVLAGAQLAAARRVVREEAAHPGAIAGQPRSQVR